MKGFTSPFGGSDPSFDDPESFVPDTLPEPGPFLADHEVLTGDDHCAVHATAAALFDERGVYDATFGYNLARLNRDQRHPDAGYRYAVESGDGRSVLRAEFTPTTPFCPQSNSLVTGSFRAWNGLVDRHEFDLVRVRVAPMHEESGRINDRVVALERELAETGSIPAPEAVGRLTEDGAPDGTTPDAPF